MMIIPFNLSFIIVICCIFHKISNVWLEKCGITTNKYILTTHGNKIEICLNRNSAQLSVTQELSPWVDVLKKPLQCLASAHLTAAALTWRGTRATSGSSSRYSFSSFLSPWYLISFSSTSLPTSSFFSFVSSLSSSWCLSSRCSLASGLSWAAWRSPLSSGKQKSSHSSQNCFSVLDPIDDIDFDQVDLLGGEAPLGLPDHLPAAPPHLWQPFPQGAVLQLLRQ